MTPSFTGTHLFFSIYVGIKSTLVWYVLSTNSVFDRILLFHMWKLQPSQQGSAILQPHHDHRPGAISQGYFLRHPRGYEATSAENGLLFNVFSAFSMSGPCLLIMVPKSFFMHWLGLSSNSLTSSCLGWHHHLYSQSQEPSQEKKEISQIPHCCFFWSSNFFCQYKISKPWASEFSTRKSI